MNFRLFWTAVKWGKTSNDVAPVVTLAGTKLVVVNFTAHSLQARLPAEFVAGDYLLTVSKGSAVIDYDEYDLTIGAVGPQGLKGDTGATGPQGPKGNTGATGIQGVTGPQGPKGDTGATGATGPIGLTGLQGPQGLQGQQGIQGLKGDQGTQGDQGPQGIQGLKGDQGLTWKGAWATSQTYQIHDSVHQNGSSYICLQNHISDDSNQPPNATLWELLAIKGDTGETGATGPQGPIGLTGPKGDTGAQGIQGLKGDTGATGPQGPKGDQGAIGATGPQGPTGAAGPQGPIGLTGPQGEPGAGFLFLHHPEVVSGSPPSIPAGLKLTGGSPYPALLYEGTTYWAFSDVNNGVWFAIVGFDTGGNIVQRVNVNGNRYIDAITLDTVNRTVTFVGQSGNSTIAYGQIGPIGPQGPKGDTGTTGATGPQGPIGLTGSQGPIGPMGPQGPAGTQGLKGDQGIQGPIGSQGPIGLTGSQGPIGPIGPKGDTGAIGPVGVSGYEIVWNGEGWIGGSTWNPGTEKRVEVFCPIGKKVLGGGTVITNCGYEDQGWNTIESVKYTPLIGSYPIGPDVQHPNQVGWIGRYLNTKQFLSTDLVAYCINIWASCANVQ